MQKNNEVSVVVVHYGHGEEVFRCLDSLAIVKKKFKPAEIILVDNNEEKLERKKITGKYPWVKYVPAPKNLGWGGGHNLGFKKAKGEYIFSLDSDILINDKVLESAYKMLEKNKKIAMVSARIRNISGGSYSGATLELTPLRGIFYLSFINKIFPNNFIAKKHLMSNWDRKTTRIVEVAQLAAFMMRKSAYLDIGGFDEDIFVYFEENDVSKRLSNKGWYLYFDADSEAIHLESRGTPKELPRIKEINRKSRFYYFKKYYGLLPALLVESFARFSKYSLMLLGILLLGTFLRFYRFYPNLLFSGEVGTDYMNVWNIIHGTRTFLIGPRTSHEWFFISPIAYWIYVVLLYLWNYNPVVINVFWGIVGSLSILVCYHYVKKLFNEKVALISSFLVAISPAWILQTRNSRYNPVVAILFLPYLLYLSDSINDKGKSLFKLGIILGLTMSFFPSPLLLVPAVVVSFLFYRVKPKFKYILNFILGFLIPNITFLIYEISDKFNITVQLLSWVPYRILGFFGVYHKNTADTTILSQNFYSIYKFFSDSLVGYEGAISTVLFILIVVCSLFLANKLFKNRVKEMSFYLIIINLLVCYIGLFIHGNPPGHYYMVIFPIPMILVAYIFDKLLKKRLTQILCTLVIGGVGLVGLVRTNWYFAEQPPIDYKINLVPYSTQFKLTEAILKDSNGMSFSLGRIGTNDQFENNFANNYIYLLTIRGEVPDSNSKSRYLIVEGSDNYKKTYGIQIFSENNVYVFKSKI